MSLCSSSTYMPLRDALRMYPRLFPVHTLADDDGVARPSDGTVAMPPSVKTMQESLKTEG